MSHGKATVESGFSINKSLLIQNLDEESIVSQRRVHDYVMSYGGIREISVDDKMIQSIKGSRTRWRIALEEKRKKMKSQKRL